MNSNKLLHLYSKDRQYTDNIQWQKEQYRIRQMEKLNEFENSLTDDKVRQSVIKPQNINKDRNDLKDIKKRWEKLDKTYKPELTQMWKSRTNQPYKNIIKDKKHIDKFINRNNIKKEELIIHTVTDKDKEGVDEDFVNLKGKLQSHNDELKKTYSTSKETEHKKQFEYNHKYKYREQYKPSDHNQLKQDKIEFYKKEQHKMEQDKEKKDNIINSLVNNGDISNGPTKIVTNGKTRTVTKEPKVVTKKVVKIVKK